MFLTVEEVAQRLRVSRALVYRLIERGDLASHHIGASIRIAEEDLQDYLQRIKRHGSGGTQRRGSSIQLSNLEIRD